MTMTDEQAKDLSVYGVTIEKDGKRIDPERFYDTRTDEQVLWQAMGRTWDDHIHDNIYTDKAFVWSLLDYMMRREDWEWFHHNSSIEYTKTFNRHKEVYKLLIKEYEDKMRDHLFIKWLLTDPARFVKLCADWCREHEEVKA